MSLSTYGPGLLEFTRTGSAGGWTGLQPATAVLQGGRTKFLFNTGAVPAAAPEFFLRLKAEELP